LAFVDRVDVAVLKDKVGRFRSLASGDEAERNDCYDEREEFHILPFSRHEFDENDAGGQSLYH
jgi:hypothetical protein